MQYAFLIYATPESDPAYGTPEFDAMMKGYMEANETYRADGVMVSGEPLQGIETATSLRIRGGKAETMDGPFAETKERLGGFYILDCKDLDDALRYAAMIPTAKYGTIEVRPVMMLSEQ